MHNVRLIDGRDVEICLENAYSNRYVRPQRIAHEGLSFYATGTDHEGVWHYRSRLPWPTTSASAPVNAQFVLAPEGAEGERFTVALTNGDPPAMVDRAGVACPLWGKSQGVYQYFVSEDTT
jgi:hypothetical protein